MTQQETFDFSHPQRQSTIAILLVVFKTLKVLIRQIALPFFVFFFMGKKNNDFGTYLIVFISAISLISMVYSIINHYKSYYYVVNGELVVISGIVGKKKLSIPLERIQTINFEQNLIHRLFNVKRLKIDTAGSGEKELELAAIDNYKAESLRQLLLSNPCVTGSLVPESENTSLILRLSFPDLLRAGLVENHLKSGGLIFVFLWWIYANLQEVGINAEDYIEEVNKPSFSIELFLFGVSVFLAIALAISLIKTVFKYFNLTFKRSGSGFSINMGLLNTQTISALDHKIQTVSWSDNLLKKLLGIYDLKFKQASSKTVESKESILLPACSKEQIKEVCGYVFPGWSEELFTFERADISYLYRSLAISVLTGVIAGLAVILFSGYISLIGVLALIIFLLAMSFLTYKKLAWAISPEWLFLKGGAFGDKNVISALYKTQSIKISQNPFQRRKSLVNLTIYNASGSETFPFINKEKALKTANYILFKVESDKRHWM